MGVETSLPPIYLYERYEHYFAYSLRDELTEETIPVDMTGWEGIMQVRKNREANDVLFEASSTNGYLKFDGNKAMIDIPGNVTGTYTPQTNDVEYALMVWPPGERPKAKLLAYGTVSVTKTAVRL